LPGSHPFNDLLVTKLEAPVVRYRIVPRRRLTDVLRTGMERRLTLLVAPTGYGKTTLLVEWLSGILMPDWRIIWLTIDALDNEPLRLWSYVATALKKVYPRLHFDPQRSIQDRTEKSPLESLTPLFNAITQIPYQLVLVLDDYQWITDDRVHAEIRFLLDHQPKNLHLLISSRVKPKFPLSRLRAQRQLVELTAKDLSFNLQEAKNFFSSAMEVEIDPDQAASLLVATEGWIAGLQLVTLSLQGQPDRKSFIANLPEVNQQIFEYLTEEVLDQQTPELRDFLLKTSLLSEFSAPLCDAMLERKDSLEMLNRIQQANLFIVSLDEYRRWFSYHRLFADTLQKYLRDAHPEMIPDLHRRACAWLRENGFPDKAVTHALAFGDLEQAARIIDACAIQAVIAFDLVQLAQWLSRFSDELISKQPRLAIYYALANFLLERFDKVEPKLQALEQILGKSREKKLQIEDEKLIRWEIAAIRVCLNYWQGNSAEIFPNFTTLMQNPPESDVYFSGLMLHNLAEVCAARGDLEAAVDAYSKGCRFAIDYGLLREYCYSKSELAYVRKIQGRLHDADRDYQDLIDYALRFGISDDVVAFAKTGLAEIALEQNQMDLAGELVRWVIDHYDRIETSPLNWIRQEWLFVRLARFYLALQDIPNALSFFEKAIHGFRANRQVVHYLSSQLIDTQVKIWSATGELSSRNLNIEAQLDFLDPTGKSNPARQTALVRYYLAQGEPEKAFDVLNELIPELEEFKMQERLLEVLVIQALACQAAGYHEEAIKSLHQAIQIAVPQGYRRVFTDEGDPMKTLLKQYIQQSLDEELRFQAAERDMVSSLIAEMEQKAVPSAVAAAEMRSTTDLVYPMSEPFSHRELGILKLIADGKSTKEIAVALMISVNTTKVHIKSIYRKTGTHTRTVLLQRVIELGILKKP
jgi:LuxR family transcriptional regulator, maltose regulon positive regulatory protein